MGTLKQCLAVTKDFTVEDFDALDSRAKELAGDKKLADSHYIRAAQDIIKTLEQDIQSLEQGVEPEAKVETKAPESEQSEGVKKALEMGRLRLGQNQWSQYAPKGVLWGSLPDAAKAKWADAVEQGKPTMALAEELAAETKNSDLTDNTPEAPKEREARLRRSLARISKDMFVSDAAAIEKLLDSGDLDGADAEIKDWKERIKFRTETGAQPPRKSISIQELNRIVEQVNKALGGDSGITILESVTDIDSTQKPGTRAGGTLKGVAYLFRDGIPDGVEGLKTVFHELFHKGLRNLLPKAEYTAFMNRMYDQSAEVRALADAYLKTDYGKKDTAKMSQQDARALAVEEALAEMAETFTANDFTPSLVRKLGNIFADIADRLGLTKLAQYLRSAPIDPLRQFVMDTVKASVGSYTATYGTQYRTVREAVNDMADKLSVDGLGKAKEFVLASSFLRDLGSRFGEKLKGVNEFVKTTFDMSARAADLQEAATKVQEAFTGLPAQERKQLMEFMADVTAADVVIEPNEDRNNNHLSRVVDGKKVEDPKVKELQDRFAKMSAKQKAAYRVARDGLADNWKRRGDLLARTADEVYNPLIKAAREAGNDSQVRQLERQRRAFLDDTNKRLGQISGDYFPMLRFGEWVVVRKSDKFTKLQDEVDTADKALEALYAKYDKHTAEQLKAIREANKKLKAAGQEVIGEYTEEEAAQIKSARKIYNDLQSKLDGMKSSETDYYVAQFESESEARRHAKEIKGTVDLKRENLRELNPISRTMLTRLEESLAAGLRARGDTSALREAKKAMYEVFLQTLPERSAILRQAKRKNVAGFDRDMERAIITTMLRDSFYLSRMEFGDKISEALNVAYRDADDRKDVELKRVHNELARRLAASLRYVDTPIQDALAGFTYIYKLGISPGYLFANMTQPFTVSLPMMWARHGAKSNAAFAKAWSQTSKMVAASLKASLGRGEINFENAGLPADEVAMLNEMLRNRLLNVTMVADLARTADGLPTSKFASLMAKPSHFVEVLNRISTALAAYRLEKSKSGVDGATAYAKRVLADTHFDYSVENAPYWMKPGTVPMNKILFQFKKYQLGMISLFVKAAAAMASGDKIAKKEAKAQIFGVMMTHLAVGGVLGMPGFGLALTLANIVSKAFGDDDEPWDSEVALRNYLADTFGKEAGAALSKGLPMLVNADMSKKVGLGDLLNPVPTLRDDKKGRDFVLELLAAAAGPFAGGILPQFGEAASFFAKGDFIKGTEQLLPKWISDPIRAGRFAEEGVTTKQGTVALDREAISAWDVALQAAGVPAARITESYEARAAIEGKKSKMAATASEYKKDWLEARRDGDNARAEEIWQEIKTKTNPVRARNGLEPITKSELFRFERERAKTEKKYATVGGNTNQKMGEVGRFALQ